MQKTVLILGGSGKIGRNATEEFQVNGWTVRQFNRAKDDLTAAATGVDVILNGFNPPNYHNWEEIIPQITKGVIGAAKASGASVIIPGNVYNFGNRPGIWDETTPEEPCSRKGRIRVAMEDAYRDAGIRTVILRAGNFIDPGSENDVASLLLFRDMARNRLTFPGDPHVRQSYCYVKDWARAARQLADMADGLNTFEDIPFPGHTLTAHHLAEHCGKLTGSDVRITGFPWWLMRVSSPVWELARELLEMRYLWSVDHQLGAAKFKGLLPGFEDTPIERVLEQALADKINPNQRMAA